ncbi:MAG: hypothetical protein QXM31_02070 [Candidatus Woesearchaeota archaeon]
MADRSIIDYIRTQLQRGYPPEAIRTALLKAGYNPQDIDFALRITTRTPERKIIVSGRNLAMILGGILTIALLVIAGFIAFKPASKDIHMAISIEQPSLMPGETLKLTATLTSQEPRIVPVALNYVVSEKFTRKSVSSRASRISVGKSAIDSQSIILPEGISPGDYEVTLTATYEQLTRIQKAGFTVQQPAQMPQNMTEEIKPAEEAPVAEELQCPASCDDLNPATDDACIRGICEHTRKPSYCGDGECSNGENKLICPEDCGAAQDKEAVLRTAVSTAKSDPEKAATLCNSLILPQDVDPCFSAIASASMKSALCTSIQDLRIRDDCLWEFTKSGDYSVCEQMSNRYLITSCLSLARFSSMEQQQAEAAQIAQQLPPEE